MLILRLFRYLLGYVRFAAWGGFPERFINLCEHNRILLWDVRSRDGVITACTIHNGCRGNTAGLAKMVVGRKADDVKELLRGIPCRGATSCPDQLARAIDAYEQQEAK